MVHSGRHDSAAADPTTDDGPEKSFPAATSQAVCFSMPFISDVRAPPNIFASPRERSKHTENPTQDGEGEIGKNLGQGESHAWSEARKPESKCRDAESEVDAVPADEKQLRDVTAQRRFFLQNSCGHQRRNCSAKLQ